MIQQALHISYAFIPTFIIWFIHRPFISRVDLIKYVALGCISFIVSLLINYHHNEIIFKAIQSSASISPEATAAADQIIISSNSNSGTEEVVSQQQHQQQLLEFYKYLFMDAINYSLISISTVSITCLFTRWHFPITFINTKPSHIEKVFRYLVSLIFVLFSFGILVLISNNQTQKSIKYHMCLSALAAAVMGVLWFISGLYFLKRYKAIILSTILATLFAVFSTTTTLNDDHGTTATTDYQITIIMHWFLISLALALSCNTLDYLDAILNTFPHLLKISKLDQEKYQSPYTISYWIAICQLVYILIFDSDSFSKLNSAPIKDLETAIRILGPASRSWKTMAALFPVNLRQDLCLLYAFFRTADDLVDDVATSEQGEKNLMLIRMFLQDIFCSSSSSTAFINTKNQQAGDETLPPHINWSQYASLLPYNEDALAIFKNVARISHYLCPRAMFELTSAWEHDLDRRPVKSTQDLLDYAAQISGTFGELCTCVIMYKTGRGNWGHSAHRRRRRSGTNDTFSSNGTTTEDPDEILSRARSTGQCLQLINIARDIIADSLVGRCYVPLEYMSSSSIYTTLTQSKNPFQVDEHVLKSFSLNILDLADQISERAQKGMDGLPKEVQNSVRAAFHIYMAIGTTLRNHSGFHTRAKVPKWKQEWIAFCCIYLGGGNNFFFKKNDNMGKRRKEKEQQEQRKRRTGGDITAVVATRACEIQL